MTAIVNDREGSGYPEQLTALIIEPNWFAWRTFLKKVDLKITRQERGVQSF